MKRTITCLMLMGSVLASQAATLVPITSITGHHQGDGNVQDDVNGGITRVINGVGLTKPDPADPTTWTHNTGWTDGWQGQQIDSLTLNQGWVVLDVGAAPPPLGALHLWNVNEGETSIDRGVATYQIYFSDAPTVMPPLPGGTALDYDFSSGGWTALGGVQSLPIGLGTGPMPISGSVSLGGLQAQYIGLEIITNHGSTIRTGLAELALTELAPVISPADTVFAGTPVTLSVDVLGTNPTYQWYKDSVLLPGETSATLSIASAVEADSGAYHVEVSTDETGAATSSTVTLTVNAASAPVFTQEPESLTRYPGGDVTLSVTVDGSPPIALQWALDGTAIPGATESTLTLVGITEADAGSYTATATNDFGAVTSAPGVLTVRIPAAGSYEEGVVAQGPLGYWRLDETTGTIAYDYVAGNDATHEGGVLPGQAGLRPGDFDGMEADNNAADYNGVDGGSSTGKSLMSNLGEFTIMLWLNPRDLPVDRIGFVGQNDVTEFGLHNDDFAIWTPGGGYLPSDLAPTEALELNAWNHIAATGDGSNLRLYVNGIEVGITAGVTDNYGASGSPFNFAFAVLDATGNYFTGLMDEVVLFTNALDRAQINGIYNLAFGLVSPTIVDQPADQTLILGDLNTDATFSVQASGTQPLSFQWKFNGVDIPDATNDTLVVSNAVPADVGTYTVAVSNVGDTILSDPAELILSAGPVTPSVYTTLEGDNVTFGINMPEDSTGYTYQWQKDGGDIAGATGESVTLTGVVVADSGTITVDVTLGPDMATSDPAGLTVLPQPTESYLDLVNGHAPSIYWRLGDVFNTIVAADELGVNDGEYYTVGRDPVADVAVTLGVQGVLLGDSNTAAEFPGTSDSKMAFLDEAFSGVLTTPSLSVELWALSSGGSGFRAPASNRDIFDGDITGWTFYATDAGTWQWRVGDGAWTTVEGGEVVNGKWTHLVGTYDVGTGTMNLFVDAQLVASQSGVTYIGQDFNPLWIGSGANEDGAGDGNFFWVGKIDEVAIYDRALPIDQVQEHYAASLGVGTGPVITGQPQTTLVLPGTPVTMRVGTQGLPPITYQWQKDTVDIPGATAAAYDIAAAGPGDVGVYRCVVANPNDSVTSDGAALYVYGGAGVAVNFWDHRVTDPNFTGQPLAPADVAGLYPMANWDNAVVPGGHASGDGVQPLNPTDQDGTPTTMDVRWSSQDSWRAGASIGTPDEMLAYGYLDDGDTPDPNLDPNNDGGVAGDGIGVSVTVANVPYSTYAVVLYLNSDQGSGGNFGTYTVNGVSKTGGVTDSFTTYGSWVDGQNVLTFFSEDPTVNIRVAARAGTTRTSLAGFQIIDPLAAVVVPPPITLFEVDSAGGTYSVTWDSIAGTTYKVESATDLVGENWGDEAGSTVTATGESTTHSGPVSGDNANYRVVENPAP